jgi:hypothetical protein
MSWDHRPEAFRVRGGKLAGFVSTVERNASYLWVELPVRSPPYGRLDGG